VKLELNDGAYGSIDLVGEVLQAAVGICDGNDLDHELARWGWGWCAACWDWNTSCWAGSSCRCLPLGRSGLVRRLAALLPAVPSVTIRRWLPVVIAATATAAAIEVMTRCDHGGCKDRGDQKGLERRHFWVFDWDL